MAGLAGVVVLGIYHASEEGHVTAHKKLVVPEAVSSRAEVSVGGSWCVAWLQLNRGNALKSLL